MRLSGTLRTWNDDRGFGFIAPTHGGAELFVHISALPRDGSRPTVGEKLSYELGRGKNGQPQATNVQRDAIGPYSGRRVGRENRQNMGPGPTGKPIARRYNSDRRRPFVSRITVVLLIALGAYGFDRYQNRSSVLPNSADAPAAARTTPAISQSFKCDGRTYCSQMTSCAEAKFFLKSCPGTKMDGDHNGIPCEQQWCN